MAYEDTISVYDDRSILEIKGVLNWSTTGENKEKILFVLCDHIHRLEEKVAELEEKLNQVYGDLYD